MILRFIKVTAFLISFIFLTGFIPFISLLGPSFTVATTGSVYKAGFQFMVNKSIKDTTGKNSLDFVKEKLENKNNTNLNEEIKKIVEKRIELVRKKLNLENINQ